MSVFGDAALAYAGRGMAVFPLRPKTKEPHGALAPHGHLDATTDVERVRSWWAASPDANIGLACAPKLLVLDEDPRNGGDQALEDLFMRAPKYGFETLTSLTGGGGRHFLFQHPLFDVGVKDIAPGLDIKSKGYIAAPPSIHPSGKPYAWQDPSAPITEVPEWLLQIIAQKEQRRESAPKTGAAAGAISEGQRNDALFKIACSLRGKGLSEAAIRAALLEENRSRCSPPLPHDEVRRIAASAGKYEPTSDPTGGVVRVDIPLSEASIADLNRLAVFAGRLRFDAIWRRGANTFARVHNGREMREVRWGCDADLLSFARSQSVLMGAGVLVPSPRKGEIREKWESAVRLILMLANDDRVDTGDAVVLEAEEMLSRTFRAAGRPIARDEGQMARFMMELSTYRRYPTEAKGVPPAVFIAESNAWVHVPTWRAWMSTPFGYNRLYSVKELRDGLAAVGFQSASGTHRGDGGAKVQLDLWKAAIPACLAGGESE